MRVEKQPMNMIFYGPPGSGKTSAARIISSAWDPSNVLTINGSLQTGIENVRDRVEAFACPTTLRAYFGDDDLRVCFIDEADYLSQNAQASLRVLIEGSEGICRFIFAVNDLSKIQPALRSRLQSVQFGRRTDEGAKTRVRARLAERLSQLGRAIDPQRLDALIADYYPDLRAVNNAIDFEFGHQLG
jgi:DNA polymerase III delta prime subunit